MSDIVEKPEDMESLPVGAIVKLGPRLRDWLVRERVGYAHGDWLSIGDERSVTMEEIRTYWLKFFPGQVVYRPTAEDEQAMKEANA
ncbi:hypothetical protein [Nocardia aurea]|uniref:hypothetical protein n=1 Tax=Nocardia aurea TaxID=2144174 RepID=UPI0033A11A95